MNDENKKYVPVIIRNERKKGKGLNIFLEILIFIGIFFVTGITQSIVSGIPVGIYIFNNIDFNSVNGNFAENYKMIMNMLSDTPDWMMIVQLFSTIIPMILIILYCKLFEKRKMAGIGFTKTASFSEYLKGLLVGLILFGSSVLLCIATGSSEFKGVTFSFSFLPALLLYFAGFMVQGAEEEVMCRGYFMISASRKSPVIIGVLANSIAFGLFHLGNPGFGIIPLINIILFGLFMSVYVLKRGNLWGACAIHSIWNYAQGNIFGLQVSGLVTKKSFLNVDAIPGKDLLSGGSFGPEGGLCVTMVLIPALIILFFTKHKDAGQTEE